ncbi:hypothetical protein GGR53DRAFT_480421 [Hypoxylon sp. FL1150]|nr:hypothetical protein GGR53DRAFT_480421 [Hypoxylon sp. FL1150]
MLKRANGTKDNGARRKARETQEKKRLKRQKGSQRLILKRLTRIEGGRVDSRGIDGRTLSAVRLGGIHSVGDDAMLHVRRKRRGEACRATCLDIVGLDKNGGRVNDAREERVADLGKMGKCVLAVVVRCLLRGGRGTMQAMAVDAGLLVHVVGRLDRLAQTQVFQGLRTSHQA